MTRSPDFGIMEFRGVPRRSGHPCTYDVLRDCCRKINPRSYLEIGVFYGASLLTVLDHSPELCRIVLCDPVPHIDDLDLPHYQMLLGYSRDLIPTLDTSEPFDLILVDGDHTTEEALNDMRMTIPLLRPGGLLVFDDSTRPALAPACDFALASGLRVAFEATDPDPVERLDFCGIEGTVAYEKVQP